VREVLLIVVDGDEQVSRCGRPRCRNDVLTGSRGRPFGKLLHMPAIRAVPDILDAETAVDIGEVLLIVVDGNEQMSDGDGTGRGDDVFAEQVSRRLRQLLQMPA